MMKNAVFSAVGPIEMQLHKISLCTICNAQYLWCLNKRGKELINLEHIIVMVEEIGYTRK